MSNEIGDERLIDCALEQGKGEVSYPVGMQIRRMTQVSNGANTVPLVANVTAVLPLNGDGLFNEAFNNPEGYGSADLDNNWFDVRYLHPKAHLNFRVTVINNAGGTSPVTNANIIVRIINDTDNPGTVVDAPSVDLTLRGQGQLNVTAYRGTAEAIQVCMKTTTNENIRVAGIYLSIDDIAE